ncbi:MAG: hypothetical protein Q7V62_08870, partial [Actinomycetota bacterium]|nr:hypothetical protein [Actinomycetota bacterium]
MGEEVVPERRGSKARSILSVCFGIVALVGLVASVVAIWARSVLADPSSVSGAVEVALEDPAVTDALAVHLTDQLLVAVNVEQFVDDTLPTALRPLSPALVGGIRSLVTDNFAKALATERTRAVVVELVERAHARLLRVLGGDGLADGINVSDESVSVNLLPLMTRGLVRVQELGLLDRLDVPELSANGDPAAQIAELEAAFGRDLPDDFGQLVVFSGPAVAKAKTSVANAQRMVVVARRGFLAIIALTVVSFAASLLLARRRRRAVLVLFLAAAGVTIVTRAITRSVVADVPNLVIQPGARAAVSHTVTNLTSSFITVLSVVAFVALVVAIAAFLTGPSGAARS